MLNVPVKTDDNANVMYKSDRASLRPSGKEQDIELFYNTKLDDSSSLSLNVMGRFDPGHSASNEDEYVIGVKYNLTF
jgi:hypothetical protein